MARVTRVLGPLPQRAWRLRTTHKTLIVFVTLGMIVSILGPIAFADEPPPDATPTESPSPPPTDTPAPSPTDSPSPSPTDTPTDTPTGTPAPSPSDTASPSAADSPSPSDTASPSPSETPSPSPTPYSGPTASIIVQTIPGLTNAQQADVIARNGGVETSSIPVLRLHVVDVPAGDVSSFVDAYAADADVASGDRDRTRDAEAAPSDPAYSDQWSLPQIGWGQVYGSAQPAGFATLAVLDTGVAPISDLSGHLVPGWSAFGSDPNGDPNGHGTWLSSIAAADTNNAEGIAGVAYDGVKIMPVQVLDASGQGQDSDIIAGLVWAVDHGANVVLMGFSNPGFSDALQAAVDYAWSQGVVLVAATGNDGSSAPTYPAGDAEVVGVSATDQTDALWSGSNYGADTFLAAPGVSIPADDVAGGTTSVTGTSAAAAHVAAAAALLKSVDPSASNGVIVGRLARNADPAGTTDQTGNGRLNLARAITDTSTDPVVPAGAPSGGLLVGPYTISAAENLEGWANTSTTWVGTVQGSNSAYKEGQSIPVRYSNTLAAGSTHTLVLKYDFISSGVKHFMDHLTSVDRSIALTTTQICDGLSGCSGSPSATASIPVDTTVPAGAQFSGQQLRAWNISSLSFVGTTYGLSGGIKSITINFTVAAGTGNKDVAIAYSVHLARENEWGIGNGASSAPGASQKGYTNLDNANNDKNVSINPNATTARAQIQGFVYNDVNGNGVLDIGEPGIAGVTVTLSGTASTTAITQSDGSYSFSGLFAGTYNVDYTEPSGFVNTGSPRPRTGIVVTDTGVSTGNNFFAQQRNGVISGTVLNDADGSGTQNGGEGGLANAQVKLFRDTDLSGTLTGGDAQVGSMITTGAAGTFSFTGLTVATYFVTETNPSGYASTAAVAGTGANTTATVVNNDQIKVVISAVNTATATATNSGNQFLDKLTQVQADLSITKSDGKTSIDAGASDTYTIVVSNGGPFDVTGATVTDAFPSKLTGVTWTCIASAGSSCPASGSGDISASVNLLSGGMATFTVSATVQSSATGTLDNTASVAAPAGTTDPNTANNSATDSDAITRNVTLSWSRTSPTPRWTPAPGATPSPSP